MDQLRNVFAVTLGGEEIPLRYELVDWMEAERKLKERLYPWGKTPFWREQAGEMALRHIMVFTFVGILHARPAMTWEEFIELVDWDQYIELEDIIGDAVADFFQRIGMMTVPSGDKPKTTTTTGEDGPNSGPMPDTTSDLPTINSSI